MQAIAEEGRGMTRVFTLDTDFLMPMTELDPYDFHFLSNNPTPSGFFLSLEFFYLAIALEFGLLFDLLTVVLSH
jgi:hypothetical protein